MGCIYSSEALLVHNYELKSELLLNSKDNVSKETFLKLNNSRKKLFSMFERKQTQPMPHFQTNSNLNKFKIKLKKASTFQEEKKDFDICYSKRILKRLSLEKFNELFDESNIECFANATEEKNVKHISYVSRFNNWNKNNLSLSLNSTIEHTLENKVENYKYDTPIKNKEKN